MLNNTATQPSASTTSQCQGESPSCINWLFPATTQSPIQNRHSIGRDSNCGTVLSGHEISRRHAEIQTTGPIATIVDLESRNGVFVNGQRVSRAPLRINDVIRCGEWVGIVEANACTLGYREITPGWFGGDRLVEAIKPASRVHPDLPIIIQGETGTGKEGAAQAVHRWSNRGGPFIAVNCAALPEQLAESELFGHRRGAFSGAEKPNLGLFRAADGGTLFLDEILELPRTLQAKLLRALEMREVLPLGESKPVPVDVRIVAATQESLRSAAADSRFRADLLARLDGLTVVLPPLRERRDDIVPLFLQFLERHAVGRSVSLDAKFVECLCVYDWPLNVRELALLARRLLDVHLGEPVLKRCHLPEYLRDTLKGEPDAPPGPAPRFPKQSTKDEAQFEALVAALRENAGNVAKAAAAIGINRHRANRLLAARPDFSRDELKPT